MTVINWPNGPDGKADQPGKRRRATDRLPRVPMSSVNRRSRFPRIDRSRLPQVLLIEDLAELLRCSVPTIRRRVRSKKFPVAPLPDIDKKLRWSMDAVCDWIDACSVPEASLDRTRTS